jgi:hypothetical protein
MLKLKDFVQYDKINWRQLSANPNAIHLLEQNPDKIDWVSLSQNPNAIHILEQNPDKISWDTLSANPNAIQFLEQNMDKISWFSLSKNPSIFELDYKGMKEMCSIYKEELICKAFHPSRIAKYLNMGLEMEDLDNYL